MDAIVVEAQRLLEQINSRALVQYGTQVGADQNPAQ